MIRPAALSLLIAVCACAAPEPTPRADLPAPYTGPPVAGFGGSSTASVSGAEAACTRRVQSQSPGARIVKVNLRPGETGTIQYRTSARGRYICFVSPEGEVANITRVGGGWDRD